MTRLLSGLVLGAVALAAVLWLPSSALRLLACLVAVLATREYLRVVHAPVEVPALALVAVGCWLVSAWRGDVAIRLLLAAALWVAYTVLRRGTPVQAAATQAFALVYIGLPLGMLASLHLQRGARATILLLGTIVASDSAQYYVGRRFGRRPLAPAISPKKTREGAVGGVVVGTVVMVVGGRAIFGAPLLLLAGLGVLVVVAGIFGDLFESSLKRASGMKDSSTAIPGHGGVLDRIDALLFAVPVFYVCLQAATL